MCGAHTGAASSRTRFHDNAARHLVVEPDPVTGELWPAIKDGKPACLYLWREVPEVLKAARGFITKARNDESTKGADS